MESKLSGYEIEGVGGVVLVSTCLTFSFQLGQNFAMCPFPPHVKHCPFACLSSLTLSTSIALGSLDLFGNGGCGAVVVSVVFVTVDVVVFPLS